MGELRTMFKVEWTST